MRAIVLEKFGGLDSLVYKDIPEPEPKAGHVVIQIKALGINHAEMHMRRGEWAEAAPVSGIECVGIVKSCPRSRGLPQFQTPFLYPREAKSRGRPRPPSSLVQLRTADQPTMLVTQDPKQTSSSIHRVIHRR